MLREYHLKHNLDDTSDTQIKMNNMKILHTVLLKELPPERFQGIMNVLYVGLNKNATSEEIEGALVMCDSINCVSIWWSFTIISSIRVFCMERTMQQQNHHSSANFRIWVSFINIQWNIFQMCISFVLSKKERSLRGMLFSASFDERSSIWSNMRTKKVNVDFSEYMQMIVLAK